MKYRACYSRYKDSTKMGLPDTFYYTILNPGDGAWSFMDDDAIREFVDDGAWCDLNGYPDLMLATPLAKRLIRPVYKGLPAVVAKLWPP